MKVPFTALMGILLAASAFAQRDIQIAFNAGESTPTVDVYEFFITVPSADRFLSWAFLDPNDSAAQGQGGDVTTLQFGQFIDLGPMSADPNAGSFMAGAGGDSVAGEITLQTVIARLLSSTSPAAGHGGYVIPAGQLRTTKDAFGFAVVDVRYAPGATGRITRRLPIGVPEPSTLLMLGLAAFALRRPRS